MSLVKTALVYFIQSVTSEVGAATGAALGVATGAALGASPQVALIAKGQDTSWQILGFVPIKISGARVVLVMIGGQRVLKVVFNRLPIVVTSSAVTPSAAAASPTC